MFNYWLNDSMVYRTSKELIEMLEENQVQLQNKQRIDWNFGGESGSTLEQVSIILGTPL
jgi:hypothetical protein